MSEIEKVKWTPATKENEFVNEMWELFASFGKGEIQNEYTISFEAMDCFFRNVYRWRNPEAVTTPILDGHKNLNKNRWPNTLNQGDDADNINKLGGNQTTKS